MSGIDARWSKLPETAKADLNIRLGGGANSDVRYEMIGVSKPSDVSQADFEQAAMDLKEEFGLRLISGSSNQKDFRIDSGSMVAVRSRIQRNPSMNKLQV